MPDEKKPRLVVSNSNPQRDHEWAEHRVRWALRDMAANLLRVIRGAGKPYAVIEHTRELAIALDAYRDAMGRFPHDFAAMLDTDPGRGREDSLRWAEAQAQEEIIRGALQITASRLVEQNTQEQAGNSELYQGIRSFQEARTARLQAEDAARPPAPRVRPVRKPKPPKARS